MNKKFPLIFLSALLCGLSYAEIKMAEWICWYNSERLNGAIFYLTPDEVFEGKMGQRLVERKQKLYDASVKRQEYWKTQPQFQAS